nr:xylulose kinase-1 [Tanacetum cinerariifolium]
MKRTGRDHYGRVIILPLTTAEEHIAVQSESKARTTLLQSIPDDHVADFHYMDDARDIWNAVKARENELGRDNSAFSVFTTNSEDVEGRPLFHRFAKADSMKVMPPPLSGDYTSLSDHSDLDESHMSYCTKSSTSSDS